MLRLAGLSVSAILLAIAGSASAESIGGTVETYDNATRMVTLDSGATYKLLETVDASALQPGIRVTMNVESMNGEMVVDQVLTE